MKRAALLLSFSLSLSLVSASSCPSAQAAPAAPESKGRLLGIAHMALFVSDLAKSRAFYRDFLGFGEPFSLPKEDGSDRIAFIKVNEQQYIELFAEPPRDDGRIYHISFYTDDAEALRKRLGAKGIKVPPKLGVGKIKNTQFGIDDPDGHDVELVQYLPEGWSVREKGKFLPDTRISARIAHLGVLVGKLSPSLKFYGDLLGFKETWRGGPSDKVAQLGQPEDARQATTTWS